MVAVQHNFDGGPNGATITVTNSAQVSGNNPFDATGTGGNIKLQYGSLAINGYINSRPTAEYIMGVAVTSGSPRPYVAWLTTVGNQTEIWTRFYFYLTSATPTTNDLCLFAIANASGVAASVWLNVSSLVLQIQDSAATPNKVNMTTVLDINVWHRIEFHVIMGATTGSSNLFLYAYPDTDIDISSYTETVTQTGATYGAPPATQYLLGQALGTQTNLVNTFFSNWALNNTGYIGPAPFRAGLGSPAGGLTNPIAIHSDVN
jgi:hypothetical protein